MQELELIPQHCARFKKKVRFRQQNTVSLHLYSANETLNNRGKIRQAIPSDKNEKRLILDRV